MADKPVKVYRYSDIVGGENIPMPELGKDIRTLVIELHSGREIEIELFERSGSEGIVIRTSDGYPMVKPMSSNVIRVDVAENW